MNLVNKTDSIRTRIFKAILYGDFTPGDQLPTERKMAVITGSSRVTVRRAYEQLEAAGILKREQGRGTFVATHFDGNPESCGQIALLTSVSNPFALEFIRAVEKELVAADMLLVLRLTDETPEKEEQAAVDLVGKGVNNLIIWPSGRSFSEKTFGRLRVLGANMVFFDRMLPGGCADYVGLDNHDAMYKLFAYAVKHGLKKPVFVTHSDLNADSDKMREEAFRQRCAAYGLKGTVVALPQKTELRGRPEKIAADATVFCVNDAMASRLRPYLSGQLLLGIDGLNTNLVSCKQPMAAMARAAVASVLQQQHKSSRWKAKKIFFKGELVNVFSNCRKGKSGQYKDKNK